MSITSSTLVHSTYGSWMASTMVFTVPGIQVMADMVATNASTAVATGARWASWKATRSPGKASRSPSGPRQRVPPPGFGRGGRDVLGPDGREMLPPGVPAPGCR